MRGRWRAFLPAAFALAAAIGLGVVLLAPAVALASGNDVGHNLGQTLRHYAGEIYGGVIAIVGLIFLVNRRLTELAMFLVAAILVGWLVFDPGGVAEMARAIGERILP